jgi:hypothetical protein
MESAVYCRTGSILTNTMHPKYELYNILESEECIQSVAELVEKVEKNIQALLW